jgi:hypothetical protein
MAKNVAQGIHAEAWQRRACVGNLAAINNHQPLGLGATQPPIFDLARGL